MCGRYVRRSDKQKIAEYFHANPQPAELPLPGEDYNVAPTTFQPIIRQSRESGERELVLARWGLVPFFTKELSDIKGLSTINARAESITKAPTWREPMKKRRCIVPASCGGNHRRRELLWISPETPLCGRDCRMLYRARPPQFITVGA